jgi:hypothetical protein
LEVKIDAYGSIDTGSGGGMGFNGAIGANHGVFNSLGASSRADANAFQMTVMASRHVYIPKNEGNEVPLPKKEEQKKSWNVWSWS